MVINGSSYSRWEEKIKVEITRRRNNNNKVKKKHRVSKRPNKRNKNEEEVKKLCNFFLLFSDAFNDHTQRKFSSNLSLLWKRRAELCVLFYSALIRFYWILILLLIPHRCYYHSTLFLCLRLRTLIFLFYFIFLDTTELLLCDAIIRSKKRFHFHV